MPILVLASSPHLVEFNFVSSGYAAPLSDSIEFQFGTTIQHTVLVDASLNLSAFNQALQDMLTRLDISDGNFLQDFKSLLALVAEASTDAEMGLGAFFQHLENFGLNLQLWAELFRDVRTSFAAKGEVLSDIHIMAYIGKLLTQDLGLSLDAVSPTIFRNLHLSMNATDGAFLRDVTLALLTIPLSKPKRTDVYHRMSSVILRVT